MDEAEAVFHSVSLMPGDAMQLKVSYDNLKTQWTLYIGKIQVKGQVQDISIDSGNDATMTIISSEGIHLAERAFV